MHRRAFDWVARHVPDRRVSVIDVGGRNINGSVKDLFDASSYTSVDLFPGRGVDLVADFTDVQLDPVDVVVCCEVAEHTDTWRQIIANAAAHLNDGGLFIFTAAGPGRAPHSGIDGNKLQAGEHYENIEPDALGEALGGHFARWEVDVLADDVRAVAWR